MIRRFFTTCLLAALALAVSTTSIAQAQSQRTIDLVPAHAGGFVHVNMEQLLAAEQLELATDLINRVDAELASVFKRLAGVDAMTLQEASFMIPPLEIAFAKGDKVIPTLGIFSFREMYDSQKLLEGIGGTFTEVKGENSLYYRNEFGVSVLFLNDHTFLFGSEITLDWWLRTLGTSPETEPLVNAKAYAHEGATVTAALNTSDIPSEFINEIPLPIRPFGDSNAVMLNFYIDQEVELFLAVDFDTPADAARAERNLRSLIDLGRTMLRSYEREFQTAAASETTFESALSSIGMLSLVRHADAHLQNIRIGREDYQIHADLAIDTPMPVLVMGSMAAIAAIGDEANAEFNDVAVQLDQAAE